MQGEEPFKEVPFKEKPLKEEMFKEEPFKSCLRTEWPASGIPPGPAAVAAVAPAAGGGGGYARAVEVRVSVVHLGRFICHAISGRWD